MKDVVFVAGWRCLVSSRCVYIDVWSLSCELSPGTWSVVSWVHCCIRLVFAIETCLFVCPSHFYGWCADVCILWSRKCY